MPKITVRMPTEQYAYIEAEYDSLMEYQEMHPQLARAIVETRARAKKFVAVANTAQEPE